MKRSPLKPDPAKVRIWMLRSRKPLSRGKQKRRSQLPLETALAVSVRSRGRCVVCGSRRRLQKHHVLPVQHWPQYELEELNLVIVDAGCHDEHERAHRRIRWDELPQETRTWIRTLGGRETLYAERTYRR